MSERDRIHVFYLFIYFLLHLFLSLEMHQLFLYIIMTVPFIDRNKAHLIFLGKIEIESAVTFEWKYVLINSARLSSL